MDEAAYGRVVEIGPLVRRLLAPNPSPFTFTGTQTHIVGRGEVAIIDPGPDSTEHIAALLGAVRNEQGVAIVCTHNHRDHTPATRPLKEATGAPVVGCAPLALNDGGARGDESFDWDYAADRVLGDGETLSGDGWTLEAVATPGHTSNHLCFALPEANALFSGDHVMGWSTSIVSPPDGDMGAYMASLYKLLSREERIYYPAHGLSVEDPHKLVRGLILHRRQREAQILRELERGEGSIPAIVASLYAEIDPGLHPAAERSVLAHLVDLEARGLAVRNGDAWRRTAS
jgi:glyoxylase-like metal-dependent hydrolase (beta-lactamase superfamily II)